MCVSDTSERSREGFFARGHGQTAASGCSEAEVGKRSLVAHALSILVHGYRLFISPIIGPRCRFLPTCSDYALDALAQYGAIRGGWLTLRRLARCHPFGGSGFDPVPQLERARTLYPTDIERQAGQCRPPEPMV